MDTPLHELFGGYAVVLLVRSQPWTCCGVPAWMPKNWQFQMNFGRFCPNNGKFNGNIPLTGFETLFLGFTGVSCNFQTNAFCVGRLFLDRAATIRDSKATFPDHPCLHNFPLGQKHNSNVKHCETLIQRPSCHRCNCNESMLDS